MDTASIVDELKETVSDDDEFKRKALVTGSVALGAIVTSSLFRKIRHLKLNAPTQLSPALEADVHVMECMEGSVRFYHRDGSGVPIVLLHSINAAASSYEMKPIFEHFAEHTNRPIFALDWLGFGRSDRPPVRYTPALYQRHLRRFLSEHVHQAADILALSLACEYTAEVARSLPYLVHRLAFLSPTGMSRRDTIPAWQRTIVTMASSVGAFEIFFYRLTRPEMLRSFYERQVFAGGVLPDEVVAYAHNSTLVYGAHHAPRYFIDGRLTGGRAAAEAYSYLRVPLLVVAPRNDGDLIQHFDALDEIRESNPDTVRVERLDAGLMPQWERPQELFQVLEDFLISE